MSTSGDITKRVRGGGGRCRVRHYQNDWFFTARQRVLFTIYIIEKKKGLYQFLIQVALSGFEPGPPGWKSNTVATKPHMKTLLYIAR